MDSYHYLNPHYIVSQHQYKYYRDSSCDRLSLEVRENLNEFLAQAVAFGVLEIENEQVSLEEVFMAYYGQNEGSDHDQPVAA